MQRKWHAKDLGTSPRSALLLSQREGQVFEGNTDRKKKWEWKIRNYSAKLKFSTGRMWIVWWESKVERTQDGNRSQMLSFLPLVSRDCDTINCNNFKRGDAKSVFLQAYHNQKDFLMWSLVIPASRYENYVGHENIKSLWCSFVAALEDFGASPHSTLICS